MPAWVVQRHMSVLSALDECLTYIRRCVPAFDEVALRTPVEPLDFDHSDWASWASALAASPAAIALRSRALAPFTRTLSTYETFGTADLAAEVTAFQAERRRLALAGRDSGHHPDLTVEKEWRRPQAFLMVEPAYSLSDGAAYAATSGYFDENNMPPWDTWIAPVPPPSGSDPSWGPALLCWLPPWARERVESAIYVNPEHCLQWVEIREGAVVWT